ncbi:MAG: NADPH-dependent FMN reductase [Halolamina sp.]
MSDTAITLLGISGSQSTDSRTRTAVEAALSGAHSRFGVETDLLHLGDYDLDTADGRTLDAYEGDTAAALEKIVAADAYVVGTPVYRASYSGALKNLLDMVPRGQWQGDVAPFENAAVGLVGTGATQSHYLAVDEQLRPLFAFFGAHTVGSGVYADDDAFADGAVDDGIRNRLETLGEATVELADAVETGSALAALEPQV